MSKEPPAYSEWVQHTQIRNPLHTITIRVAELTTSSGLSVEIAYSTEEMTWQENLAKCPAATAFQSYPWATAYHAALNDIPIFVHVRDEHDDIVAQLLLFVINQYERETPPYNRILRYVPSHLAVGTRIVWQYGPLIQKKSDASRITDAILDAVLNIAKEWSATQIYGTSSPLVDHSPRSLSAYKTRGFLVRNWGTFITDTGRTLDQIWASLDKKARNDVRRAEKELTIKDVESEDELRDFAALLTKFNRTKRGIVHAEEAALRYYKAFWKHLHVLDREPFQAYRQFLTYRGDQAVAGLVINSLNGNVTQHSVISDGSRSNLGGPLLTWHAIRWSNTFGSKTLDLVGVNPLSSDSKERAIYFYKSKWAGTFRDQYHFIMVRDRFKDRIFLASNLVQRAIWRLQ